MNPEAPQLEFPSLKFPPGRTVLYLFEVAEKLGITEQHVADLIAEGKLQALNIAGKNCTARQFYRVPIEAYDAYIQRNVI